MTRRERVSGPHRAGPVFAQPPAASPAAASADAAAAAACRSRRVRFSSGNRQAQEGGGGWRLLSRIFSWSCTILGGGGGGGAYRQTQVADEYASLPSWRVAKVLTLTVADERLPTRRMEGLRCPHRGWGLTLSASQAQWRGFFSPVKGPKQRRFTSLSANQDPSFRRARQSPAQDSESYRHEKQSNTNLSANEGPRCPSSELGPR